MLALGASLITGAPKADPSHADSSATPQEKIQNVTQKPADGIRAPSLPDAPTTGADQIKQGMPQAMPDDVDDVLQGVDGDDDRQGDVHDALKRQRDQKNKNQNNNQNLGNKIHRPNHRKVPSSPPRNRQ